MGMKEDDMTGIEDQIGGACLGPTKEESSRWTVQRAPGGCSPNHQRRPGRDLEGAWRLDGGGLVVRDR